MIELGDRVKDIISGATGIVYGITEYLFGCKRIVVTPEAVKDGKPADTLYLDEPQCMIVQKHALNSSGVVAEAPAPTRTGGPRDGEGSERRPDARR